MNSGFSSFLLVSLLLIMSASCSKETDENPDDEPTNTRVQQTWTLVSVKAYADRGLTQDSGFGYYSSGGETYEFRNNGKLYAVTSFGRDTADYQVLPDDSTMLVYQYVNGVRPSTADTIYIRTLTDVSLILATINPAKDWGKFTFKRD